MWEKSTTIMETLARGAGGAVLTTHLGRAILMRH
jgi:hypothetical protein